MSKQTASRMIPVSGGNHRYILFHVFCLYLFLYHSETREGFLRKNIVAVSFFQNCAIHQYS